MKPQKEAGRYAQLSLGAAILAFGLFNVHQQSRITEGGVLGATLLLQHWLGISPAISEVVMDVACYLLGIKYLGKSFLRYSLVATGGFAVFYALFARMGYLLPSMAHLPLLAAVVKVSGMMEPQEFFENMHGSFAHKFASKPEVLEGNMKAIRDAWEEVVAL